MTAAALLPLGTGNLEIIGIVAFACSVVARTAYVVGVGIMLRRQEREEIFTRRYGPEGGYDRFRRISTWLMIADSSAFIAVCILTANSLHLPVVRGALIASGLVIGIFGLAVKTWATATLGTKAFYWHNFFVPRDPVPLDPPGPYRFLKNPMYGVGYLQTYGLALVCASWPGLVAAAFMQVCIMIFNELVEKPHFESLLRRAATRRPAVPAADLEQQAAPRFS